MRRFSLLSVPLVVCFLLAAAVAVPVLAQEQSGAIEGTVTDKDGAALPGATVEASGPSGTVVAVSDAAGEFRFPRLVPGLYKVTTKLDGFVTAEYPGIDLKLGKILKVSFTMQPGTFEDTITVAADSAIIDVTQSATAKSIRAETIALVPRGRDFTAVATLAAGTNNEAFAGGLSIDGSSGSENRFVIDGIDTTDPQTGVSAQNMVTEFIDEVQVKSAGYAAEYGGSTGGVINAITRTGGNDWHAEVGVFFRNDALLGTRRPYQFANDDNEYTTIDFPKDEETRWEPSASVSGPIVKDRLWFFAAYQPSIRDLTRVVEGESYDRTETEQYFAGNVKGNVGSRFLYKVSANLSPYKYEGTLPDNNAPPGPDAILDVTNDFTADSYSAYGDLVFSDSFLMSARLGYFKTNQEDAGYPDAPNMVYQYPLPASYPVPEELRHPQGWNSNPNNSKSAWDIYERSAASLDASWFVEAAGAHSFKAGVQYEKLSNSVESGEINDRLRIHWNRVGRWFSQRGTYGSVEVRRSVTTGDVTSNNLGLFVQDSWAVTRTFTLNVGIRTEKEQVPNYDPSYGKWAIDFGYGDKLAPRIGFAWDVAGDQRWKVYGSYGTYFDITKMEMPRGSFGGDRWISYEYNIEDPDWTHWQCAKSNNVPTDPPCTASTIGSYVGAINLREPSTGENGGIDPDMKPYEQREYQLGVDYQLNPKSVLSARFVHKDLIRAIEDVGHRVTLPDGSETEIYTICNPGESVCKTVIPGAPDSPKPKRVYDAVELYYVKRFTDNWLLNANYTWSELDGNYSGLASSDEFGRVSPNVNRFFDSLSSSFDENGDAVYGLLNTDRTHQLKVQAVYQFPFKLSVGVNQYVGSGTPISTRYSFDGVWYYAHGRNDQGRTPTLSQTDLMLRQEFKVGGVNLEATINVLNLFDEDTVTNVGVDKWDSDILLDCPDQPDGQRCFFESAPFNSDQLAESQDNTTAYNYLKPIAWQQQRSIRIGLRVIF